MSILAAHQNLSNFLSAVFKANKSEGGSVSPMPLGEEAEDRNNRAESQGLLLPKAGHPASPSQGLLATLPAAALRKTSQALC